MKLISGSLQIGALPAVSVPSRAAGESARYGVGEVIKLLPTRSLPSDNQPYYWAIKSGGGQMHNLSSGTADYTAADFSAQELMTGADTKTVQLSLKDSKNAEVACVELTIVRPSTCGLMFLGGIHTNGQAKSGFWGQPVLMPNDVSFMNLVMRENRGTGKGTGVFQGGTGDIHAITAKWVAAAKVVAQGTLFDGADQVFSRATVPSGGWVNGDTLQVGTFEWDIAWEYKLASDTSASGLQFYKAWHRSTCTREGTVRTEKGGAYFTAKIFDATIGAPTINGRCPYPLL
ncbi:hypothetical protein [Trinickia acidisoli]|uniref:hypothetical protein n=1 Tax=Trinickia acidisoli TaxID=2767482 RepID=UPI001A8C4277|nr:hypothetical protein [Trinickia acidisoli]